MVRYWGIVLNKFIRPFDKSNEPWMHLSIIHTQQKIFEFFDIYIYIYIYIYIHMHFVFIWKYIFVYTNLFIKKKLIASNYIKKEKNRSKNTFTIGNGCPCLSKTGNLCCIQFECHIIIQIYSNTSGDLCIYSLVFHLAMDISLEL